MCDAIRIISDIGAEVGLFAQISSQNILHTLGMKEDTICQDLDCIPLVGVRKGRIFVSRTQEPSASASVLKMSMAQTAACTHTVIEGIIFL